MGWREDVDALRDLGWSWTRIAAHYGVSERAVTKWLLGEVPERVESLPRPAALEWETTLVVSDMQFPSIDWDLFETTQAIAAYVNPDQIVWNGDSIDFQQLSTFAHNPYLIGTAKRDVEDFHARVRDPLMSAADVGAEDELWVDGNHEHRVFRYIRAGVPGLGIDVNSTRDFLQLPEATRHWRYAKGVGPMLGRLLVNHGWRTNAPGGYAAKNSLVDLRSVSVLLGHTHRVGMTTSAARHPDTQEFITYEGWEMGHACDPRAVPKQLEGYEDWVQCAGALVRVHRETGVFQVDLMPVKDNDTVVVGGAVFTVERTRGNIWVIDGMGS